MREDLHVTLGFVQKLSTSRPTREERYYCVNIFVLHVIYIDGNRSELRYHYLNSSVLDLFQTDATRI